MGKRKKQEERSDQNRNLMQKAMTILEKRQTSETKFYDFEECLKKTVNMIVNSKFRKLSVKLNFMALGTHSKPSAPIFPAVHLQDFQLLIKPCKHNNRYKNHNIQYSKTFYRLSV